MANPTDQEPQDRAAWEAELEAEFGLSRWEKNDAASDEPQDDEPAARAAAPEKTADAPAPEAQDKKVEDPAGDDDTDDGEALDESDEDDDEGEDEDDPAHEPAADEARDPAEPPEAPPAKEFSFKADGKEFAVPGGRVVTAPAADGTQAEFVVMPKAEWDQHVQPRLADRSAWNQQVADFKRQLAERDPETSKDALLYRTLTSNLDQLIRSEADTWEDDLLAWADGYRKDHAKLQQEAEEQSRTAREQASSQVLTPEQEEQRRSEWNGQLEKGLKDAFTAELATLPQEQREAIQADEFLRELVEDYGYGIFFQAKEGMKDGNGNPLTPGMVYVNGDLLSTRLQREVKKSARRVELAKQAADVEARNQEKLRGGRKSTAHAAPRAGSHEPPARSEKAVQSKADWERDLEESYGV